MMKRLISIAVGVLIVLYSLFFAVISIAFANIGNATPLTSGTATGVFGQPNLTSNTVTTTATGLAAPQGLAFDSHGNLYITDEDNNRTLRYNAH